MKLTIADYGAGNIRSVQKAIEAIGYTVNISSSPKEIAETDLLILPGQGAFEDAMTNLKSCGIIPIIKDHIQAKKPYLGICLGLQILFETSEENGIHEGLGIFKGNVKKFQDPTLKIPHMGWNTLTIKKDPNNVFDTLTSPIHAYFVHSYYIDTPDKDIISTTTDYGISFTSSIQTPHLLATQFHPEKSSQVGLTVLANYLASQLKK
ncbi:MAG: imidazole glycerol phosphate synthase subunit HisH [Candidatus Margulisbacteria bacterium]|nr:imidazole glycerol phosphate synthase subunit HisH [Candidatus Margulisiibacteriota bacterium]